MRCAVLVMFALGAACAKKSSSAECPVEARGADAGRRIRTIAEVPQPGRSVDGRELDVPLDFIHLLADPSPTGSAPTVVVGASLPCGFVAHWATAAREGHEVRVRLRARWGRDTPPPATPEPCATPTPTVQLVSLSVMRVGDWRVTDAALHPAGTPPAPVVTAHIVRDDASLAPPVARWFRACTADAACAGGAVCARIGEGTACLPPLDPWQWSGQGCIEGARAVPVSLAADPARRWTACVAACVQGACPAPLRCDPLGVCVHPPVVRDADAGQRRSSANPRHETAKTRA